MASHKLGRRKSVRIRLVDDGDDAETLCVPVSAIRLFLHLLTEMSQGNAVTLIPTNAELTTQQAADLLNVSRPYMAKLLDEGKVPGRTVGKYRRVRLDDLMAFKQKVMKLGPKCSTNSPLKLRNSGWVIDGADRHRDLRREYSVSGSRRQALSERDGPKQIVMIRRTFRPRNALNLKSRMFISISFLLHCSTRLPAWFAWQ